MRHEIGDSVRLRDGSDFRRGFEPWGGTAGRVTAVFDEGTEQRVNVRYGETGPVAFGLLASEFVPDRPGAASPA